MWSILKVSCVLGKNVYSAVVVVIICKNHWPQGDWEGVLFRFFKSDSLYIDFCVCVFLSLRGQCWESLIITRHACVCSSVLTVFPHLFSSVVISASLSSMSVCKWALTSLFIAWIEVQCDFRFFRNLICKSCMWRCSPLEFCSSASSYWISDPALRLLRGQLERACLATGTCQWTNEERCRRSKRSSWLDRRAVHKCWNHFCKIRF